MQRFGRRYRKTFQRRLENTPIRFIRADLARDEQFAEMMENPKLFKDRPEPAVEV